MTPQFSHPRPLPTEQPVLSAEVQNTVTQAQRSLERLNQLINTFENPKVLIRPIMRKEAHSTSVLEGVTTAYEKLVSNSLEDLHDQDFLEVKNFMDAAEYAVDWTLINKKIDSKFIRNLHQELFYGIKRLQSSVGEYRNIDVEINNSDGYKFYPMQHGSQINNAVNQLLDWFKNTKKWDPVIAISCFHYYFEAIHPFEDGNGRIGRLLAIIQLKETNLLDYPILDISTWLKGKKHLYHFGFQKITEHGDWESHIGILAAAIKGSAEKLIVEINQLNTLQNSERDKVKKQFRSHSRALEVIDYAMSESEFTVPELSLAIGISFKSANALVSKLVELGSLTQVGDSQYDRRFKNQALFEYAKNGF